MLLKELLTKEYILRKKSISQIAIMLKCSESKINYWIGKHGIKKRSISESLYYVKNPNGDPFVTPAHVPSSFLVGLGMGIFWGEGTKKSKTSVRLGNSDPSLIRAFVFFLQETFSINREKLRFGIQIFEDMDKERVLQYWISELRVPRQSFLKSIVVSKSNKKGTYKEKSYYGVVTVYFNNVKLKRIIDSYLEDVKKMY